MRARPGRAATALAAAALALAAAGCSDLVSSLTPFGVGDRKPDQSQVAYSGVWAGPAGGGGGIAFEVSGGEVRNIVLQHVTDTCTLTFAADEATAVAIDGDSFTYDAAIDPQGRILIEGQFVSSSSARGNYSFEGRASTTGCPTSGSGGFSANKL